MIVLWILLWILIIIGAIIGLVLFIVLVLCLGQIKYRVDAHIGDDSSADIEIRYLMRLVRFAIIYKDGETKTQGRVAWFKISDNATTPKEDKPPEEKEKPDIAALLGEYTKSNARTTTRDYSAIHDDINESDTKHKGDTKVKTETKSPDDQKQDSPEPATSDQPNKKPETSTTSIISRIRAILTYPDLKTIIGLCFQALVKLLRALKPKQLDVHGVVGFDDPATTGIFMGSYEAAMGVTGLRDKIRLLGCYYEKALRLEIHASGRVRLGRLIWPLIWLYLKRPIRRVIHKYIL